MTAKNEMCQESIESFVENYHKLHTVEAIELSFKNHLKYTLAKDHYSATELDKYFALAMTIRDRLVERWIQTSQTYHKKNVKRVYYLSMEYLIGRAMGTNVLNLKMDTNVRKAMNELNLDFDLLREEERDAGLGNGGLGRLAACFLDSMATLELPGYGYGLRYDYGIFRQKIRDGYQIEEPDNWLRYGCPWELERPEYQFKVQFGGHVDNYSNGKLAPKWQGGETVVGIPYDFPIAGYGNNTVNNLRLWTAKSVEEFDLQFFNNGDYIKAYESKMLSETITNVLYPNDSIEQGKELRFKQQYFFVCCSLKDIVRRFKVDNNDFRDFPNKVAIQLNDTHPSLAVAELMRILMDEEHLGWDQAWNITQQTLGYTNHTLMPEALEKWPVHLFEQFLPRHLTIIYEINRRFLRKVMNKYPNDPNKITNMSLIEECGEKQVRMAYLSVVGSHSVNGVAELHSQLIKESLFKDFYGLWPEKFNNKTNGITQRRWLLKSNPELATLITDRIGDGWITDLYQLKKLEAFTEDAAFQKDIMAAKRTCKERLAEYTEVSNDVKLNLDSIFDTQVKRLHEYKRQVLNVLHIIHRYFQIKDNPSVDLVPRTFIFSAKAAPGYYMAKLIIKLINDVAGVVNNDPDIGDKMKVVFLNDYRVSLAERIIPASDLSEQISTAGTEASGTGNMKFSLNGALTIGTLDGANIEIREEVGAENFFLFGHTNEQIEEIRRNNTYNPWDYYNRYPELKRILDALKGGFFDLDQPDLYQPIWDALLSFGDHYFHLADFHSYVETQSKVDDLYRDQSAWARMCILNIANMGKFSSDRTIKEYADDIWGLKPCHVQLDHPDGV